MDGPNVNQKLLKKLKEERNLDLRDWSTLVDVIYTVHSAFESGVRQVDEFDKKTIIVVLPAFEG